MTAWRNSGNRTARSRRLKLPGLAATLRPADVLLIVPPFGELSQPSLGVHLLQACGRSSGVRVRVLYGNLLLARVIGEKSYNKICASPLGSFAGERLFARCAYGVPPLGRGSGTMFDWAWPVDDNDDGPDIEPDFDAEPTITLRRLRRLEARASHFIASLADAISAAGYRIVGCTSMFEQTSAAVALLNGTKRLNPRTVTMLGGANCAGDMARGIASLSAGIDYIFSGDSEATFIKTVKAVLSGLRPRGRIIRGAPCPNLDALPAPAFSDFFEQRRRFLPRSATPEKDTEILYETSRGCWWGEKNHCTYCGLTGNDIGFRQKAPERVIADLCALLRTHPTRKLVMTDNIMPLSYFKTLLPRLAGALPPHSIFWELKANLSLAQVLTLRHAGVTCIQPGIEALSSPLLRLMKKGLLARQNLTLLRYARAAGMQLSWNLLWGFPGDEADIYRQTLAIAPLLHHLQPPDALSHIVLERHSPYLSTPGKFGLRNVQPMSTYYDFLPRTADVRRLACFFTADYPCGAHARLDVIRSLWHAVQRWHAAWKRANGRPAEDLFLYDKGGSYGLVDTRRVAGATTRYALTEAEARSLLTCRAYSDTRFEAWAVRQKLAIVLDDWFVPLAIADPEILLRMDQTPQKELRSDDHLRPREQPVDFAGAVAPG